MRPYCDRSARWIDCLGHPLPLGPPLSRSQTAAQTASAPPARQAAKLRGVPVFNAPFSNTRSVAELVVAEVIALARQLGDRSAEMHAGTWRKVSRGCYEVRGKTLGIVGYGHIGSQARMRLHKFRV